MSRPEKHKPDKGEYLPKDLPPAWVLKDAEDSTYEEEASFKFLEARTKYIKGNEDEKIDHLLPMLIAAEEAIFLKEICELYELIDEYYPNTPLKIGERVLTASPDARARARFLNLVLGRILQLKNFPATLRNDLSVLLSAFPIEVSESRVRAQQKLVANPTLSIRAVADLAEVDQSDLSQWIKAGLVIDPSEGQRTNRPPRPGRGLSPER
jgi:hypothetical protein